MAVGWVRQQLILYGALLRLIQARFVQVTGTSVWKTLMAAYYTHFHEGQRYWRRWANVRRHSSKSCPVRPISLTTGRNALPQLVHKQAAPKWLPLYFCLGHNERRSEWDLGVILS